MGWVLHLHRCACHSNRGRKDGGGLHLHRCAHRSLVDGNERNRRGRCSLRNVRRHIRLLLALGAVLGFPDALNDSDGMGRDFFVPGVRAAATAATALAGAALSAATEFAIAAPSPPYFSSSLQMSASDIVPGCVPGCVRSCAGYFCSM